MKLPSLIFALAIVCTTTVQVLAGEQYKYMSLTCSNADCSKHEAKELKDKKDVTLAAGFNTKQPDATKYEKPIADLLKAYTDKNWTLAGTVQDADGHQVFYLRTAAGTK
jgi:hypothetical protein